MQEKAEQSTEPRNGTTAACLFCGARLSYTFVDLGMSPLCESYLSLRAAQSDGAVLPLARLRLREVLPGATAAIRQSRKKFSPNTPISPLTRTAGCATAVTTSTRWSSGSSSTTTASWSNWPATTVTCCSISSPRESRAGHRARRQRRRGSGDRRACPRWSSSSARKPPGACR